ncbi:metallophosphoesterase [Flavobacterium magnum]|uniref:Metallophosphoesterase n=1 Tax=Flavobacterium magnum TaxID=2162713 RepID=A0A2S0RJK7_9FLAO|nr:metallophosphoesterase [Flavobacterium magnum]AWA31460.1 metallophosphoesterase [Flavobacterium magnum]
MKLFCWKATNAVQICQLIPCLFMLLLLNSCATFEAQYGRNVSKNAALSTTQAKLEHTFFLVGDAGNADKPNAQHTLSFLKKRLGNARKESTLLFLGDNIYPAGMPMQGKKERKLAEVKLDNQIELASDYKGKTIFIPGNHDWYSEGLQGLKRQEKYVNEKLGQKKSFLPKDGCGIDNVKISDDITMIIIDSQWYMEDWDENPTINDDCDIKSRDDFFRELEDQLGKNQKKTVLLAIHHPLISNGTHGGQFSMAKSLFPFQSDVPLPVVGSVINFIRKTSGLDPQDLMNKKYTALVQRIKPLIQDKPNVIVVSGHEHNLQYIEKDDIKQIVSGAGSKSEAARAIDANDFSFGGNGYAVLEIFEKGEAWVSFFGMKKKKEQLLHKYRVSPPVLDKEVKVYPKSFPPKYDASVYNDSLLHKSGMHNFLWGKHYRTYYGTKIPARTALLDTLYGGLSPVTAGGGHQSMSLRLEDRSKKQYTMRGLRKNAVKFIQTMAFKKQFVEQDFKNTYAEDFLLDFYTTSHPYTPFIVGDLAEAVQISHTNPKLFYVPKQNALGEFNESFGDELYMIEERPDKGFESLKSFGRPDALVSTDDMLLNLRKDEKYQIDEKAYIRARLFDMLIGDWDRHYDQWRWGEYKEQDRIVYRPIPRDRDQAFTKYDGKLLWLVMKMPMLRHMQSFKDDIRNVKWFNMEAYPLDLALITRATREDWQQQADYLSKNLTDKEIDAAFSKLPKEVNDATITEISSNLKSRRGHLDEYAARYFDVLQKTVLVVGTDKKDKFVVTRTGDDQTEISVFRIKGDKEELVRSRTYTRNETREIWIYGLDDDDVYEVGGKDNHCIKVRLFGGQNHDMYRVKSGKNVRIYDFASKDNDFEIDRHAKKILSDNYNLNQYDYKRPKYNAMAGFPNIGFNPDDGVKVGVSLTYTVNGFKRNPYSQKHNVKANYYFATGGYELIYKGIFPNVSSDWDFQMDARITSPNFSFNFFGYGNETKNREEEVDDDMNFNRVKAQVMYAAPSLNWKGELGAFFLAQATFESIEVERSATRIVGTGIVDPKVFRTQNFAGLNLRYGFENYDNLSNPTLGMKCYIEVGNTLNVNDVKNNVPHLEGMIGFSHKIVTSGKLVFASQLKSRLLFSNDYEFYQMATIGGDFDVRAFRSERFSGKRSFFQSSDVRLQLGKIKNSIVPMRYGMLAGFDYGRVWLPGESSDKWHTAYGGGLWLSGINVITAKLNYFYSTEGGRVSFGLGFGF